MPSLRPIQQDEIPAAKRLIYEVAHHLFEDDQPLEESILRYESEGELADMDNVAKNYFKNGGTFLVMHEGEEMLGTGAIHFLEEGICELKRFWFRLKVHRRGLGTQMMRELLSQARALGYRKMRLETAPEYQQAAVAFYHKFGFKEIPRYSSKYDDDVGMELELD